MDKINSIKDTLKICMPVILEIIGEQSFSWPDRKLKEYFKNKRDTLVNNGNLIEEVNFYDILNHTHNGCMQAQGMFDYLSQVLEALYFILKKDRIKLRPIISNMLSNFDYTYLNFVGELSILERLLSSRRYRLIKIEEPLGVGKISIDFLLYDIQERKECLIEVVNLHVKSKHNNIDEWFNGKVNKKIENTIKGNSHFLKFKLQPIIWGEYTELKRVEEYFDNCKSVTHSNALLPYALWIKHLNAGNTHSFCLKFESITSLFKSKDCTFHKFYY